MVVVEIVSSGEVEGGRSGGSVSVSGSDSGSDRQSSEWAKEAVLGPGEADPQG